LDAQNIREGYGEKYQGFVQRFCPWDDGHASGRVVDVVFGMEH
jgi:CDP-glycerol glycerophosphotransferase